jgi:hypothetical protein
MTKYKYFKSKNYRTNVNLVVESDIVEVSDQTSEGGDFIPLSGTEVGSPVTGDIEIEDDSYNFKIKRGLGDFKREIVWSDDGFIKLIVTNEDDENRTELTAEETVSYSKNPIKHNVDKSSVNITDALYYAQRAYVNAIIINTNTTAINNRKYTAIATLTVTDPTPVEGQGYIVFVRNGTTTIGGVGYTSGNLIYRFYQGGAWSSTVFVNQTQLAEKENIATATTGSEILFVTPQIYNSPSSPSTANITNDLTGARIGVIQKIYHNHSVAPTVPGGWVLIGGSYVISELNIIYAEWVSGSRVEYWIVN